MSTTTMDTKTAVLARARDAISRSQQGRPVHPIPRDYTHSTGHAPDSDVVIEEVIETPENYSAQAVVVSKESEVADAISKFLADQKATSAVVPTGLDEAFKKTAARGGRTVREDSREQAIPALELDEINTAVTRCHVAISLSGTIVLDGEPDQGRRAISLASDTHVAVLKASDIVPTMPQVVEILGKNPTRPMTWIAGGSATSDIELVRVNGMHGPRFLRVIVVKRPNHNTVPSCLTAAGHHAYLGRDPPGVSPAAESQRR